MSSPHAIMGSHCAGSVRYYAAMLNAGSVLIDHDERHLPLRHSHHRYRIEGANGAITLTVPIIKETNAMPVAMRDVRISEHGNWRHLHWGALFSAYGKSPFFDYVADDLEKIFMGNQEFLLDFNMQLHNLIVDFLDLPVETAVGSGDDAIMQEAVDLRTKIGGKKPDKLPINNVEYYQVWTPRYGFQPNLSIIDLMMNEGRESIFTLMKMNGKTL